MTKRTLQAALMIALMALATPATAQEADTPTVPAVGTERGSLLVPGMFVSALTPVHDRVALNIYGFYYGEVDAPTVQVDVPIRATNFLTITPSYLYYEVPPYGLDRSTEGAAPFTDTFEENQFRIDGTVRFALRAFEISGRSMYVRRFRPTDEINRFRHRIGIAHPVKVMGEIWKPFASYEAFYERSNGGWNRDRVIAGVTVPLVKHVALQPSYIWDNNHVRGLRDMGYLQFGLIVSTR